VDAIAEVPGLLRSEAPRRHSGGQPGRSIDVEVQLAQALLELQVQSQWRRLARVLSDGDVEGAIFGQPAARADPHFRLHRLEVGQLEHVGGAGPIDAPGRRAVEPDDLVPRQANRLHESSPRIAE